MNTVISKEKARDITYEVEDRIQEILQNHDISSTSCRIVRDGNNDERRIQLILYTE